MVRRFPGTWAKWYGEVDDGTWLAELSHLSVSQVRLGIEHVKSERREFPPTPDQFIEFCKKQPKQAAHRLYTPLPAPPMTDERKATAKKWLDEMRGKIKSAPDPQPKDAEESVWREVDGCKCGECGRS